MLDGGVYCQRVDLARIFANRNLSFTETFLSFGMREGYGDNDDDDLYGLVSNEEYVIVT